MANDLGPVTLVCLPVGSGQPPTKSVMDQCERCRQPVWVSDVSRRQVGPLVRLLCTACGLREAEAEGVDLGLVWP